ncbi:GD12668 [Drosophila simulans]|uniref:GD12668 n=1 Tax=Drosophila simulans TaxID=7240 RepID=B4QJ19_DROSI|nr:GD12668 [Drosophila simulans]
MRRTQGTEELRITGSADDTSQAEGFEQSWHEGPLLDWCLWGRASSRVPIPDPDSDPGS